MRLPAKIKMMPAVLCLCALCACHKTATIYGTWEETSVREVYQVNGLTTRDTAWYSGDGTIFTFTVHHAYYASNSEGTYALSGNKLRLTDTLAVPSASSVFEVLSLTDLLLVLQYNDTVSIDPLTTVQYTYTLSPH